MATPRKNETPEQRKARLIRQREANARYQAKPEGRERRKAAAQKYRRSLEGREKAKTKARAWRARNPERVRAKRAELREQGYFRADHRRRTFNLTPEDYDALLRRQNFRCAVCPSVDSGRKGTPELVVDHDHTTGAVRGLLCHRCNLGIGGLRDDPTLLLKAADYLLKDNLKNHG